MKTKLIALTVFYLIPLLVISQITSNGTGGGAWSNTATWAGGSVPSSSDDVVITGSDVVTLSSTQSCKTVTIDAGATLHLQTGASLSTTGTVTNNGTVTIDAGTFNSGDATSDYFYVNGGTFNFNGGTLNIAGRYKQYNGGNAYITGSGTMNISTAGEQTASTIYNFYAGGTGEFSISSGSTAQIVLKNGRTNSLPAFYYSPATSNFDGGKVLFENGSGLTDIYMDGDMPVYSVESNVGIGHTLHFSEGSVFSITNLTVTSGLVQADSAAEINIGTATLGTDNVLIIASDASVVFTNIPSQSIVATRALKKNAWHYISAPVNDTRSFTTILGAQFKSGDYFYRFDESYNNGTWVQIYPTGGSGSMSETFNTAQGYAIEFNAATDTVVSFSGTVRGASDDSVKLTRTGTLADNGYNLIGNPYQATIIANNDNNSLLNTNTSNLDATNGAIYLWDQSISDYQTLSNTDSKTLIAVGQAFMVRAKSDGLYFKFKKTMQENGTYTFYKETALPKWIRSRFTLSNRSGLRNEILIGFNNHMTNGLDVSYDAGKFKGNADISLYTYLVDGSYPETDFAIQALPSFLQHPVSVKVGFDVSKAGNYTFALKDITFPDSSELKEGDIVLEDTYTNTFTDLKDQKYKFHVDTPGKIPDRFLLHFNQKVLAVHPKKDQSNKVLVFSTANKSITIKNLDISNGEKLQLRIINLLGQVLQMKTINLPKEAVFVSEPVAVKGIVLVNLSNSQVNITKKLLLK